MSSYRPRRTRLYGASYNIGESYYKKQLDHLDNKRAPSRFADPQYPLSLMGRDNKSQPRVTFMNGRDDDVDDFRLPIRAMSQRPVIEEPDDDFDVRFKARRFARKAEAAEDDDFDDVKTSDLLKKSQNLLSKNRSSFLNDLDEQANEGYVSRRFKMRTENIVVDNAESAASSRARATKARLLDLENEMFTLNSKQSEREKRNRNLKQLLSDAESSDTYKAIQKIEI